MGDTVLLIDKYVPSFMNQILNYGLLSDSSGFHPWLLSGSSEFHPWLLSGSSGLHPWLLSGSSGFHPWSGQTKVVKTGNDHYTAKCKYHKSWEITIIKGLPML